MACRQRQPMHVLIMKKLKWVWELGVVPYMGEVQTKREEGTNEGTRRQTNTML